MFNFRDVRRRSRALYSVADLNRLLAAEELPGLGEDERVGPALPLGHVGDRQLGAVDLPVDVLSALLRERPVQGVLLLGGQERAERVRTARTPPATPTASPALWAMPVISVLAEARIFPGALAARPAAPACLVWACAVRRVSSAGAETRGRPNLYAKGRTQD